MNIPYLIKSLLVCLDEENNKKLSFPFYKVQEKLFHSVYINFNPILYRAYYKVAGIEPESFILQEQFTKHLTKAQVQELIIEESLKILESIIKNFKISSTLYIAIDGVVPNAKMVQERQKAFRNSYENNENPKLKAKFDVNSFITGTTFMKRLDEHFRGCGTSKAQECTTEEMKKWIDVHGFEICPTLIYSSHLTPGESMQKIASHLRKNEVREGEIAIYGMSEVALMLSILSPSKNIYLLQDDITQVINVNEFRNAIHKNFRSVEEMNTLDFQQSLRDFVLLFSIFGYDIIPKPVSFSSMDTVVKTIITKRSEIKNPISNTDGSFDIKRLIKIYSFLNEDDMLLEKASHTYIYPDPFLDDTVQFTFDSSLSRSTSLNKNTNNGTEEIDLEKGEKVKYPVVLDYGKYRSLWYNNLLRTTSSVYPEIILKNDDGTKKSPIQLSEMLSVVVKDYLTTIAWIFRYLVNGTRSISQSWFYPYTNVPLLKDIVNTKYIYEQLGLHYRDKLETNPIIKLLVVLPPYSHMLLTSPNMRKFMSDPLLEIYYKQQFSIQRFGTNNSNEGIAIISPASIKRVETVIDFRMKERKLYDQTAFYTSSLASALVESNALNPFQYATGADSYKLEQMYEKNKELQAMAEKERKKAYHAEKKANELREKEKREKEKEKEKQSFFTNKEKSTQKPTQSFNPRLSSSITVPDLSSSDLSIKIDPSQYKPKSPPKPTKEKSPPKSKSTKEAKPKPKEKSPPKTKEEKQKSPPKVKEEKPKPKEKTPPKTKENKVKEHYNEITKQSQMEKRDESQIIQLRSFNNWVKSVLIQEAIKLNKSRRNQFSVLDLASGKGGDIQKWLPNSPKLIIMCDISDKAIEEAKVRFEKEKEKNEEMKTRAEFFVTDVFSDDLIKTIGKKILPVNIVSSQFAIHYAFETEDKARSLIQNISKALKPGGIFIATTTDATKLFDKNKSTFGNEYYEVKFKTEPKMDYGSKYSFKLTGAVDYLDEFLVPIPLLTALCEENDMEIIAIENFLDFEQKYKNDKKYNDLKSKMKVKELSAVEKEIAELYTTITIRKIDTSK